MRILKKVSSSNVHIVKKSSLSSEIKDVVEDNYRELSNVEANILSVASQDKDIKSILVTSANNGEGKTISAISLAYGLCNETSASVLLVDANLRRPYLHTAFGVSNNFGFADFVLNGDDELNGVVGTEYDKMHLLTSGKGIENPLDVFRSPKLKSKIDLLKQKYTYVVFDSNSVLSSSEASLSAKNFDGVIFVLECEKTKWEVAVTAIDKLKKLHANILGAVLNKRKYYIPRFLYGKI